MADKKTEAAADAAITKVAKSAPFLPGAIQKIILGRVNKKMDEAKKKMKK